MTESQDSAIPTRTPSTKRHVVSQLEEGMALARRGDRAGARAIFRRIIHENPHQEDAWLWLAWVAEDTTKARAYLREAEAILPPSDRLRQATAWAEKQGGEAGDQASQAPSRGASSKATQRAMTSAGTTTAWRNIANQASGPEPASARPAASRQAGPSTEPAGKNAASQRTSPRSSGQVLETVVRDSRNLSQQLRSRLATSHLAQPKWESVQKVILPAFSFVAITVVILFLGAAIANLRNRANPVSAMVLPTPAADAIPTPALKQRLDSLWTQIDVASEQENWEAAIPALERLRDLDPQNEEARKRLSHAYVRRGVALVAASKLGEAQEEFDKAIRLDAGSEELQEARHQLELYLNGLEAYYAKEPEQVIESLGPLYAKNPNYRDTTAMFGQAQYDMAVICQEKGEWENARDHLKTALTCLPNMPDAQQRLAEVEALITPPKRVVVDLSEQMMTVYQDNQPIHIFTVCTGRASAPTVPGRYEVLDKMPMAYASTWNLDMPWWIGIYWAGGSENGFHALPLRHGGNQVLWSNSLGRPCSFGCIVLDTDDAVTLYDWMEIGTVVFVNY